MDKELDKSNIVIIKNEYKKNTLTKEINQIKIYKKESYREDNSQNIEKNLNKKEKNGQNEEDNVENKEEKAQNEENIHKMKKV